MQAAVVDRLQGGFLCGNIILAQYDPDGILDGGELVRCEIGEVLQDFLCDLFFHDEPPLCDVYIIPQIEKRVI